MTVKRARAAWWVLGAWVVLSLAACGSSGETNGPEGNGEGADAATSDAPSATSDAGAGDGASATDALSGNDGGDAGDGGTGGVASALFVSFYDACLLTPQGAANCWGYSHGELPKPYAAGVTWKSLAMNVSIYGPDAICGVRADDAVECRKPGGGGAEVWNDRAYRSVTLGYPLIGYELGQRCAIAATGALYCWGANKVGQLGLGDVTDRASPTQVGSALDWTQVSASTAFTCGIRGGDLYCWGINNVSQLGDGTTTERHEPTPVSGGGKWKQVSTDNVGACAVRDDGRLYCWANVYGMNGVKVPTAVDAATDWAQVSVNDSNVCGVKTSGALYCWGANADGAVGDGTRVVRNAPTQVGTDTDWAEVGVGLTGGCARKKSGAVHCWGDNDKGQLGTGDVHHDAPTRVEPGSTFKHVAATDEKTCAVRSNGTLACWGAPIGFTGPIQATPLDIDSATDWKTVSLGHHACATKNDDSVLCWGVGNHGDLGLGNTTSVATPTSIGIAATQVAISDGHACAIATDKSLYCWGSTTSREAGGLNTGSQVSTPTKIGTDQWLRVATSKRGGCAVRADHALFCFGANAGLAQVGTDTTWTDTSASYFDDFVMGLNGGAMQLLFLNSSSAPTAWGCETNFAKLGVMGVMFGIRNDGTLAGSGNNSYGQLGDGTRTDSPQKQFVDVVGGFTDWEMVTTGFGHSCGLRHGGELYCWGDDHSGEIGDGSRYRLSPAPIRY